MGCSGSLAWQKDGLGTPEEVTQATQAYRSEMDLLGAFLEEGCLVHPNVQVKAGTLYEAYKQWCLANSEYDMGQTAFGRELTARGFDVDKISGVKWRLGVALLNRPPKGDP